jgi:ribonuclease HI
MAHVDIYTDGSCKGNPGPGGWAARLQCGSAVKELSGGEKLTTNNRMEITSVVKALEALNKDCTVTIHYDSQYMRDGITKWIENWKRNGWKTKDKKPVKNQDLWMLLDEMVQKYQIEWHWVKGHNGNIGNERVDKLATAESARMSREI